MAVGQKSVAEIILREKLLRKRTNALKRKGLGSGQLRSHSARLGPAQQARLVCSALNLPWLRLSLVRLALDKVNPVLGLAAKVVIV